MEQFIQVVQTQGFPIAVAGAIGFVFYKVLLRVMDENKTREEKYQTLLTSYGEKMAEISLVVSGISSTLERLAGDVETIKKG